MKLRQALANVTAVGLSNIVRQVVTERLDSWQNDVTGFGTTRDKTTYTAFGGVDFLNDTALAAIYHGDDLAQRMVDIVPDEMLREGFTVDVGDPNLNADLVDEFERLEVNDKFANGIRWGRLYGAGGLFVDADDGRAASKPLIPEKARGVRSLQELDKRLIFPLSFYTEPGHPKLGQAETYLLTSPNVAANFAVVHETRLILFGGATTGLWEKANNLGFDRSVLQRAFDALRAFNTGWKAVEILLSDGNQAVFKMQGLAEGIGADGADVIKARMQVMDMYRSVLRAIVVDAGDPDTKGGVEDFSRQNVTLTDYPATLDRFMLRLAAAVQIPATILYGQSPAGMNATGESDFRWFYDRIRSQQTRQLSPRIRRLVRIMLQTKTLAGKRDVDAIKIKFPSLWKETPSADAERKKKIAETDKLRIDSGELLAEEVALVRTQPDGWDRDITLSDEGVKAREAILASVGEEEGGAATVQLAPTDIAKVITVNEARKSQGLGPLLLEGGGEDPDGALTVEAFTAKHAAPPPGVPSRFGSPPTPQPTEDDAAPDRFDATDEILEQIRDWPRTVIAGGPETGKSILAARAGERYGRKSLWTDSLLRSGKSWSQQSDDVAKWFDESGDWIIEGTTAPRALRKWLATNPGKKLDATVVYLRNALAPRSEGQATMAKGCDKVWREIKPELVSRGVNVIERDS